MFRKAPPNKSFERTARQLASHQSCVVSFRLLVAGGQPLNSSVRGFTFVQRSIYVVDRLGISMGSFIESL